LAHELAESTLGKHFAGKSYTLALLATHFKIELLNAFISPLFGQSRCQVNQQANTGNAASFFTTAILVKMRIRSLRGFFIFVDGTSEPSEGRSVGRDCTCAERLWRNACLMVRKEEETTMKRSITIISTIVFTLASFVALTTMANAQQRRGSDEERARAYLIREVRHELVTLPYYGVFDWLQFQAQADGTVTLMGQVTRPTLKSSAESVVKDVEGVTKVNNQIEVLPLSPNDDRVRRAVYFALFNFDSPIYRYGMGAVPSIHIIVKNGNVTLKGIVDSDSDRNLANVRANGVSGVFSVKNELTVGDDNRRASSN
jgi:hyperosmotically inducible periplasmic protein